MVITTWLYWHYATSMSNIFEINYDANFAMCYSSISCATEYSNSSLVFSDWKLKHELFLKTTAWSIKLWSFKLPAETLIEQKLFSAKFQIQRWSSNKDWDRNFEAADGRTELETFWAKTFWNSNSTSLLRKWNVWKEYLVRRDGWNDGSIDRAAGGNSNKSKTA